jgi:hypothetical protein
VSPELVTLIVIASRQSKRGGGERPKGSGNEGTSPSERCPQAAPDGGEAYSRRMKPGKSRDWSSRPRACGPVRCNGMVSSSGRSAVPGARSACKVRERAWRDSLKELEGAASEESASEEKKEDQRVDENVGLREWEGRWVGGFP